MALPPRIVKLKQRLGDHILGKGINNINAQTPDQLAVTAIIGPSATISAMIDWSSCQAVERDAARVGGVWVFKGTRVPVAALFENLEDDASVHEFVEWFPGVSLEQARAVLEHAARSSLATA